MGSGSRDPVVVTIILATQFLGNSPTDLLRQTGLVDKAAAQTRLVE